MRVDDRTFAGVARNISRDGLLLFADLANLVHVTVGGDVLMNVELPGAPRAVALRGCVLWAEGRPDHHGEDAAAIGVQLEGLTKESALAVDKLLATFKETVLLVDEEPATVAAVRGALGDRYQLMAVTAPREMMQVLESQEVAVLVVGQPEGNADVRLCLREVNARYPGNPIAKIVLSTSTDPAAMQELVNTVKVFYFLQKPVPTNLGEVVDSAVAYYRRQSTSAEHQLSDFDARNVKLTQRVLDASRRLGMQRDLPTAGRLAIEAVVDLVAADRAYYYIYDAISETLWSDSGASGTNRGSNRSAISGIAGYVARTAASVLVGRAREHALFQKEIDDPESDGGTGDERLMAEPISTNDRRVLAVLVAVRSSGRGEFTPVDAETLRMFAQQCAATFSQMALQAQIEEVFARQEAVARQPQQSVFRREALEAYMRADGGKAEPLRISPRWVRYVYWLLVSLVLVSLVFVAFGKVDEYASGPAIVRIDGRSDLTAIEPVTVASVEVQPGQRVDMKQILVRFYDATERAELERINKEFELSLKKSLANPADGSIRESLGRLRAERDQAESRLNERVLRAPHAGVVNDVRIRAGQHLPAGTPILSVTHDDSTLSIVGLLPGHFRPLLAKGQPVRLEVSGFRYAYRELHIDSIGDEVVGPEEAKRYLGQEVADSVQLSGPVILVRAQLPTRNFTADGRWFNYHDGMSGTADVRVRSRRILVLLVPGLKALFKDADD